MRKSLSILSLIAAILLYRGSATFGTPVAVNTVNQLMTVTMTVTTPGTTACQIDLAGFIVKFKGAA